MQTDIWSLGVCVYEMVALKLPFEAPQMQQLVYKIIHDEVIIRDVKFIDSLIFTFLIVLRKIFIIFNFLLLFPRNA